MKLTKLAKFASGNDELALGLLSAIGTQDFAARLLTACEPHLPASHCTVFALQNSGRVEAVSSASAFGEAATLTAHQYMRRGFDQQDSNMLWLARRKPGKSLQMWLGHQFAEEVANEEYRLVCYGENGIRERLSLLSVFADGYRVAVSFYRNHSYADFDAASFEWMRTAGTLVCAAVRQHANLAHSTKSPHRIDQDRLLQLSGRERQLMSHILEGRTTQESADLMGVALTTALTYRYRAFRHLGIRSHRELLST